MSLTAPHGDKCAAQYTKKTTKAKMENWPWNSWDACRDPFRGGAPCCSVSVVWWHHAADVLSPLYLPRFDRWRRGGTWRFEEFNRRSFLYTYKININVNIFNITINIYLNLQVKKSAEQQSFDAAPSPPSQGGLSWSVLDWFFRLYRHHTAAPPTLKLDRLAWLVDFRQFWLDHLVRVIVTHSRRPLK